MRIVGLALLGILLSSVAAEATAQAMTGMQLLDACSEDEQRYFQRGLCAGFITGVEQMAALDREVCRPQKVTNGQVLLVVQAWLKTHPKLLHLVAAPLVADALKDAFPCKVQP